MCQFPHTILFSYSPDPLPSWITYDPSTKQFTVNKVTDNNLAGTYVINVTHRVIYKTIVNDLVEENNFDLLETVTIVVERGCEVTTLSTNTVFPNPV